MSKDLLCQVWWYSVDIRHHRKKSPTHAVLATIQDIAVFERNYADWSIWRLVKYTPLDKMKLAWTAIICLTMNLSAFKLEIYTIILGLGLYLIAGLQKDCQWSHVRDRV